MAKTQFDTDLTNMLAEVKGELFPVKASLPERILIRQASPELLYPNAGDEFCDELKDLFASNYKSTLHIDNENVLCTNRGQKDFTEIPLQNGSAKWSS